MYNVCNFCLQKHRRNIGCRKFYVFKFSPGTGSNLQTVPVPKREFSRSIASVALELPYPNRVAENAATSNFKMQDFRCYINRNCSSVKNWAGGVKIFSSKSSSGASLMRHLSQLISAVYFLICFINGLVVISVRFTTGGIKICVSCGKSKVRQLDG
jgi:hypothetical protein